MIVWITFYMITGRTTLRTAQIEGEAAATPIPGEMGVGFLLLLWMLGLLILGLCAMFNIAHRSTDQKHQHHHVTR